MHKINGDKAQTLTDTVHSSGAGCGDAEWVPGEGAWGAALTAWGAHCLCETNTERSFCFSSFFIKAKIPFGFLSVSENRD